MDVGRKTLTVLQMAVPYFSANCISPECTGENVLSRKKLASVMLCSAITDYSNPMFFCKMVDRKWGNVSSSISFPWVHLLNLLIPSLFPAQDESKMSWGKISTGLQRNVLFEDNMVDKSRKWSCFPPHRRHTVLIS